MPRALKTVARKSGTDTARGSSTVMPSALVRPKTEPPRMPPPAMTVDHAFGKWSRPWPWLMRGVRPNSPIQTMVGVWAHFAHPDDGRGVEQAAILQVAHQRCPCGIEDFTQALDRLEVLAVRVP